jgi:hypothetical protein
VLVDFALFVIGFLFCEFWLGANDGDVGGAGASHGSRTQHPDRCIRRCDGSNLTISMDPRARETAPPEPRSGFRPRRRRFSFLLDRWRRWPRRPT